MLTCSKVAEGFGGHAHVGIIETNAAGATIIEAIWRCSAHGTIATYIRVHSQGRLGVLNMTRSVIGCQGIEAWPMGQRRRRRRRVR